jgi:YVTN family beta-propeller protein
MQLRHCVFSLTVSSLLTASAFAAPGAQDRVYTADQNTNTVSVINPATNLLLGQIKLGNQRPGRVVAAIQGRDQCARPGLFARPQDPDCHFKRFNSVAFIDTATNKVKGITYIGRSPHEGFLLPTAAKSGRWCAAKTTSR